MSESSLKRARELVDAQKILLWDSQEAYNEAVANHAAKLDAWAQEARLEVYRECRTSCDSQTGCTFYVLAGQQAAKAEKA